MSKLANDTRVFKINPKIDVQNVLFNNRYGFTLAGHRFLCQELGQKKTNTFQKNLRGYLVQDKNEQ